LLEIRSYDRNVVWPIVYNDFFLKFKAKYPQIKINIVGSIRREQQKIHDIDIIIGSKDFEIKDFCCKLLNCNHIFSLDKLDTIFHNIPMQIWFFNESEYGPTLLQKTGPVEFNLKLASIAKRSNLTLSEHGLFKGTPENKIERIDENTEANIIWILLGRSWIHPKNRR
jgi:DNA polymerase/3'-5' exonuclease PolX